MYLMLLFKWEVQFLFLYYPERGPAGKYFSPWNTSYLDLLPVETRALEKRKYETDGERWYIFPSPIMQSRYD